MLNLRFFVASWLFLLAVLAGGPSTPVRAQVLAPTGWVARYNGTGTPANIVRAQAVDAQGNVYVTGASGRNLFLSNLAGDWATVKYDRDGNRVWVRRYNGPANGEDGANAIALDGAGNVLVTGYSMSAGTGRDYTTVKYDKDGNELWVRRLSGQGTGTDADDAANAIAVDALGNVLVTGLLRGPTGAGYGTVKYDPWGNQLWLRLAVASFSAAPARLALDGGGNVIVSGTSATSSNDIVTIKYAPDGNPLWTARYNGLLAGISADDRAVAVGVDGGGNVVVTGTSSSDYVTLKYDPAGNQVWVARYNGQSSDDQARALGFDPAGNVYVTGVSSATGNDWATIKYDPSGNQQWVRRFRDLPAFTFDAPTALAVDTGGNVVVAGYAAYAEFTGTRYDFAVVKYNTSGDQLWERTYNGPGDVNDGATAVSLDDQGNVIVSGNSSGEIQTGNSYATVKYDAAGNPLWDARYSGPGPAPDNAAAIATDRLGNVYVTGSSSGEGTNLDYVTIKYNGRGEVVWLARYNGPGNGAEAPAALAVDSGGNVVVAGNAGTVKYDPEGNQLWVRTITAINRFAAVAVVPDADGNVVVAATVYFGTNPRDNTYRYVTIKYDAQGNQLWRQDYGANYNASRVSGLAVDSLGNAYVAGNVGTVKYGPGGAQLQVLGGTAGVTTDAQNNAYVIGAVTLNQQQAAKYDANGNLVWVTPFGGVPAALAVDASGNLLVTGPSASSGVARDFVTTKFDVNGAAAWTRRYNGPGNDADVARAVGVDASGSVFVTGTSAGSVTGDDLATIKYDTGGNQVWARRYNGPGNGADTAAALALDPLGNLFVTGSSLGDSDTGLDFVTLKYAARPQPVKNPLGVE